MQVVHNSPYAEAALVDVYINDGLALDDFAFRDVTEFLDLPAGVPVKIDVTGAEAPDNSAPVFTANLDAGLPVDGTLLVIAAGDPLARDGNPPFDLFIAEARESAAMAGNTEFLVFHGSPDAPTVDVAARGAGVLIDDISFGEFAPDYLSVPPASYDIDIQTADNSVTAASFNADLSGAADAALAVLASGFLAPATSDDPGFGLLAVFADGTAALLPAIDPPADPMARVQVVHNSPYAEAALVDVYINDGLALDDFGFREATPFLDLPAGVPVTIDITGADAADNSSPVFSLDLPGGLPEATLQVIAAGDPLARDGNPSFDLFISAAQEAAADPESVELLVFHGSPDAPEVDIVVRGVGKVLDDVSFGAFSSGYLPVPPARYEVDVETADNSVTAASFEADLNGAAGVALSALASGFLAPPTSEDPAFGLLAVFADGTTALLPALEADITFTLIDAEANAPVEAFDPMPQDAVLDLSVLPGYVNIRANVSGEAGSVKFGLNENDTVRTESVAPYALCGDIEGDYLACHLPIGTHTVTATVFSEGGGNGEAGASGSLTFSVINNGNQVTSMVLVDADSDEDLMVLEDGMTLDLSTLPAKLNVRAEAGNKVRSVHFELSPTAYDRLENVSPFALFGDLEQDYLPGMFETGEITISATPFAETKADGEEGEALVITINVTGESAGKAHIMTGSFEEAVNDVLSLNAADLDEQPESFMLESNYPNPFNPSTTIAFTLPEAAQIQLLVYDMLGRQVRTLVDGSINAGRTEVVFDAAGLPTGTYLYRLTTPMGSQTNKMLLVK